MGAVPDWWTLLTVARHLHMSPIDLLAAPLIWQRWGALHMQYESEVSDAAADYRRRNHRDD